MREIRKQTFAIGWSLNFYGIRGKTAWRRKTVKRWWMYRSFQFLYIFTSEWRMQLIKLKLVPLWRLKISKISFGSRRRSVVGVGWAIPHPGSSLSKNPKPSSAGSHGHEGSLYIHRVYSRQTTSYSNSFRCYLNRRRFYVLENEIVETAVEFYTCNWSYINSRLCLVTILNARITRPVKMTGFKPFVLVVIECVQPLLKEINYFSFKLFLFTMLLFLRLQYATK